MGNDIVIRAEGLGKKYVIGHQAERERYTALRDVIARNVRNFRRGFGDLLGGRPNVSGDAVEEFWALKDVSFEIKRGEVVGVIGRNGAGKSTLLKVLSRITEPSEGRVEIRGRVASLLEVGTGFHPELTGRENIYLNGAILGMSRTEIRRKFDEIVTFAEVDKFLDTPVKRYSSGMYVRLAFAVAAHLEPEILVVDEVLAVGDAEFQKKCLGKMKAVAHDGRTILFVSHSMTAIQSLCSRGLLLSASYMIKDGGTDSIIQSYLSLGHNDHSVTFPRRSDKPSITSVTVDPTALHAGDLVVTIGYHSPTPLNPIGGVVIRGSTGQPIWGSNRRFHESRIAHQQCPGNLIRCTAPGLPLLPGQYSLSVWLGDWHEDFDSREDVLTVTIDENRAHPNRPPASVVGHLDWNAVWDSIPETGIPTENAQPTAVVVDAMAG